MNVRTLSPELQQKCKEELNEVPDRIPEDINYIRQWLAKQHHLTTRTDDQWLLTFLRGCKFQLEKTKQKLDYFYTSRTLVPEYFSNRDPYLPEIQEIFNEGMFMVWPKTIGPSGETIVLWRMSCYDPRRMLFDNVLKAFFLMLDILLKENDNFVISGLYVAVDTKGLNLDHIKEMNPVSLKKSIICFQKTYPIRIKGIRYLNVLPIFDIMMKLVQPFMGGKLKSRLTTYTEEELPKLLDVIPKEVLPEEYGGEEKSIDLIAADWKLKVESCRDWFLSESEYGSDENKRLDYAQTTDTLFGIEGSFRKLTVD